MKRFDSRSEGGVSLLLVFAVAALAFMACIAAALLLMFVSMADNPSSLLKSLSNGKSIEVFIYNGANRVDHQLPALDGALAAYSGGYGYSMPGREVHVQIDEKYKVAAISPGHFMVTMHRELEENGAKTITDSTLPVWNSEPAVSKRIKLPDGSTVVAYLAKDSH